MILRYLLKCKICKEIYVCRIGIGLGSENRLAWTCPACNAESRAHLSIRHKDRAWDFKSECVEVVKDREGTEDIPGINLYMDLPIHDSMNGMSLVEGGSAWLNLHKWLDSEKHLDFLSRKYSLEMTRKKIFPTASQISTFFKSQDWTRLNSSIIGSGLIPVDSLEAHPIYNYGRIVDILFYPLQTLEQKIERSQELLDVLNTLYEIDSNGYRSFLKMAFEESDFRASINRCIDITFRLFDKYDSLVLPLATEAFNAEARSDLDNFRCHRDDFDILKSIYQDIFEVLNQILVWIGAFSNLANRQDYRNWHNGQTASISRAQKWKAVEREFISSEFPKCDVLIRRASRSLRNKIGHFSVSFDISTGQINGSSSQQSLLAFHEDLLEASRILGLLFTFCEKTSLDYCFLVLGHSKSGWRKTE